MAEINLLKNELQEKGPFSFSFGGKGLASLYVVAAILAVELLAFGGLVIYEKQIQKQARAYEAEAADVDLEISKTDKDRKAAISFQRRINNAQVLLNNHLLWTRVFEEISKNTVKSVRFDTMQVVTGESKIQILGVTPSYTELGKLILGLRQSEHVLEVDLKTTNQSGKEGGGYKFALDLIFDPELLLK